MRRIPLTTRLAHTHYYARFTHQRSDPVLHGQNLNAAREVVSETIPTSPTLTTEKEEDACPGLAGCGAEVIVSRTTLHRSFDKEERTKTLGLGADMTSKVAGLNTFVDSEYWDGGKAKLTGSWSRAGMLTDEYETVNSSEEPYGRKEGVKEDLRYGCMEKYRRDVKMTEE